MQEKPNSEEGGARGTEQATHWGKVNEFFRENPTLVLSLLYIQVTVVGLLYSRDLYSHFGINVFDFAEISDFLPAAFRNPWAFFISLVALILASIIAVATVVFSGRAPSAASL